MGLALMLVCVVAAEPTLEQRPLLDRFRNEFIAIRPGVEPYPRSFAMGEKGDSPATQPVHPVEMKHEFSIAKYEVPQNLWEAVMGNNPSKWKGARNSVEMLSFTEAQEFCRRATELMRGAGLIQADEVIRLPTEAEWEYVTRAGTTTRYSFGDDPQQLGQYGWSTENAAGNDPPVGAKLPNPWGLYDVHGYLWEWCLDAWHDDYTGAPRDGSAWEPAVGERGVVRGGSWKDPAAKLTSAFRQPLPRATRDDAVGLRCVLAKAR